jgi:RNA polymerase sigma factor (sigma-70 family)
VESDDRSLLSELSRGNDSAFWSIWESHWDHLYGVCLRHLNGEHSDAADAVSRSMLIAHKRLPEYARHVANLEAWLTRLTCNVCLDIHRERRRSAHAAIDLAEVLGEVAQTARSRPTTPEDKILQAEACLAITSAIGGLPPRLRMVAELRFVEDLDYEVIARRLVITQASARKRVQQAREILSDQLGYELRLRGTRSDAG